MIDDRYRTGIFYDIASSRFCRINEQEDGSVELVGVENGENYHTYETGDDFNAEQEEYIPVPEEAIRDPVNYFEDQLNYMQSKAEFDAGFIYAQRNTKIVEK